MSNRLWGFVGQYRGNENALRVALPILSDDAGDLLVVDRREWSGEDDWRRVRDDAGTRFGTRIEPPLAGDIDPGCILLVAGPMYIGNATKVGAANWAGWHETSSGSLVCVTTPDEAARIETEIGEFALQFFWDELQDTVNGFGDLGSADAAVEILGSSATIDRSEFYLASLAVSDMGIVNAPSREQLLDVAAAELGIAPEVLLRSVDLRRRSLRRKRHAWTQLPAEETAKVAPIVALTLGHLTAAPSEAMFRAIVAGLEAAEEAGRPFALRLNHSDAGATSRIRLDTTTLLLVTDLLLGRFKEVELAVELPKSRQLGIQLARGGLLFAVAQGHDGENSNDHLKSWLRPWHQSSQPYRRALFTDPSEHGRGPFLEAVQRNLVSIVNPHRHGGSEEEALGIAAFVATWLYRRTRALSSGGGEAEQLATMAGEVIRQLFLNVREYAALGRDDDTTPDLSLLQVFFTRGGARSANRLYLLSLDLGVGIPLCVRELQQDSDLPVTKTIIGVLDGTFRQFRPNRGWGLHDIYKACEYHSNHRVGSAPAARMLVFAGDRSDPTVGVVANNVPDGDANPSAEAWRVPFQGTGVLVELPLLLPGAPTDDDQLAPTLPFDAY
jgi:hypothetical protein